MASRKNKRDRRRPPRRQPKRPLRRILIVSEDSKSSTDYFRCFPYDRSLVDIETIGGAGNTIGVVEEGLRRRDKAERKDAPYEHVYCVFDRDSFPLKDYQQAVHRLWGENDMSAIWSNECFEIWYLLHFEIRQTAVPRAKFKTLLKKRLGAPYSKGDAAIYQELLPHQDQALHNAHRLYAIQRESSTEPWLENPCTAVHLLVETLRKLNSTSAQ